MLTALMVTFIHVHVLACVCAANKFDSQNPRRSFKSEDEKKVLSSAKIPNKSKKFTGPISSLKLPLEQLMRPVSS